MRACILGIQNIKHMTLISIYTDYFEKHGIEYDLIYIDKYGIDEVNNAVHVYKFDGSRYKGLLGKIQKSILFKKYAQSIMRCNKYDFVVVWREQTAYMFAHFLERYYKGKYSVNIRDLWNLNNVFLTRGVKNAVQASAFNTVSSEGFLKYLPKAKYYMIHSANMNILSNGFVPGNFGELPIRITYLGTLRFEEYCFKLIKSFANDERFVLEFIGQGSEIIAEYCAANGITNVKCQGSFRPDETNKKLEGCHIINCAFGAKELAEKMLTPIRLYYAVFSGIPVLTAEGTWLNELASKYDMAITVPDFSKEIHEINDDVFRQYTSIDIIKMTDLQHRFMVEIEETKNKLNELLDSVFNN